MNSHDVVMKDGFHMTSAARKYTATEVQEQYPAIWLTLLSRNLALKE